MEQESGRDIKTVSGTVENSNAEIKSFQMINMNFYILIFYSKDIQKSKPGSVLLFWFVCTHALNVN